MSLIEIYGKKDCVRCQQIKELLRKRDISFDYYDIDNVETEYYKQIIKDENDGLYPLILKDRKVIRLRELLFNKW